MRQRDYFFKLVKDEMAVNDRIWVLTGDLGFGLLDGIRDTYPNRFINKGSSEQAIVDMAVGLAKEGQIPFVYSITPFLIYRPFESIRNYLHREEIPVKLIGAGRDRDYLDDGFSHHAEDVKGILDRLPYIKQYYPEDDLEMPYVFRMVLENERPSFVSLRR